MERQSNPLLPTLARRLESMREYRGFSRVTLSLMTDIPPHTLAAYEQGVSIPSPQDMISIADALDAPLSYFFRSKEPISRVSVRDEKSFFEQRQKTKKKSGTSIASRRACD